MKSELKTTLIVACLFVTFAIIGTIFSIFSNYSITGNAVLNKQEVKSPDITIINHQLDYDLRGNLGVFGTVQNIANKELSYVEIKVKFYDKNKFLLRTSTESISNLAEGEIWKFSIIYPGFNPEEVEDYEISVGEVW